MGAILGVMVTSHHVRLLAVAAAVAAVAAVYYVAAPESGIYPRCMFRQFTGLDCPGCGSQRALHALLHGHVAEAWRYNALLLIEIPFIALLLVASRRSRSMPRLNKVLNSQSVILLILASIILWTILRNTILK